MTRSPSLTLALVAAGTFAAGLISGLLLYGPTGSEATLEGVSEWGLATGRNSLPNGPGLSATPELHAPADTPTKQLGLALHELDSTARETALPEAALRLALEDLEAAKRAYSQLRRPGDQQAFLRGLMEAWIGGLADADGALNFVRDLPPSFFKHAIVEQALGIVARSDALRALEWVPQLASGKFQDNATLQIIDTWAVRDLSDALTYASQRPTKRSQFAIAEIAASSAARRDSEAALQAVLARKDLSLPARDAALGAVAGVWAMESGTAAAAWARFHFAATGASRPLELALMNWATADAGSAAEATAPFVAQPWAPDVVSAIATSWAEQDPAAAAAWVTGMAPSLTREAAIEGFIDSWSQSDPMAATRWALALPANEPARAAALAQASSAFRESEESSYRSFVAKLLPAQQAQLREILADAPAPRSAMFTDSALGPAADN